MPSRPPNEYLRGKPSEPINWRAVWAKVAAWLIGDLDRPIRLSKMDLQDGDCIVIQADGPMTADAMHMIKDHVELTIAALKIDAQVLVLSHGLDIKIMKTSQLPKTDARFANSPNGYGPKPSPSRASA